MNLSDKVEETISISIWRFDRLPEQIAVGIDDLLLQHGAEDLLRSMNALVVKLTNDEQRAKKSMGNSGFAGELHMVCSMKLKYLQQSVDRVLERHSHN